MIALKDIFRSFSIIALIVTVLALLNTPSAWAAFPGKNGRIAFLSDKTGSFQIYTMNPDGSDLFQVTDLPPAIDGLAWLPDYSPDGRRIAFAHDMTGALELYVINADGTGLRQVTHDGIADVNPRWSPDGTHLVFSRGVELSPQFPGVGNLVIATISVDGTDEKNLMTPEWESLGAEYTPDGAHIAFVSQLGGFVSALWTMDLDGSNKHRFTAAALTPGAPDISPDGKQVIFYNHQDTPRPSSILKVNLDGTGATALTDSGHIDTLPVFSPDGNKILFMSDRLSPGSFDLFVMDADGMHKKHIFTGAFEPDWGPQPDF